MNIIFTKKREREREMTKFKKISVPVEGPQCPLLALSVKEVQALCFLVSLKEIWPHMPSNERAVDCVPFSLSEMGVAHVTASLRETSEAGVPVSLSERIQASACNFYCKRRGLCACQSS